MTWLPLVDIACQDSNPFLTLALAVACGPASAALLSVEGEARDPSNGRLLYREDHLVQSSGATPSERAKAAIAAPAGEWQAALDAPLKACTLSV